MKVHHTGIIVKDLEKNVILYTKLGYDVVSNIVVDNVQQNRVVFLQNQNHKIELIEPLNENSSIYHFIVIRVSQQLFCKKRKRYVKNVNIPEFIHKLRITIFPLVFST